MRIGRRSDGQTVGRSLAAALAALVFASGVQAQQARLEPQAQQDPDSAVAQLVRDYTGLYRTDTFLRWQQLFRQGFTSTSANGDGTVTVRSLDEFMEAQRTGFGRAREMREELANVRVERQGRMATVWADFTFYYDGKANRGKLVLVCVGDRMGWKVQSLAFAYEQ